MEIVLRDYSKWRIIHSIYKIPVRRARASVACESDLLSYSHPSSELWKQYTRCSTLGRWGQEGGNSFTSQLQSGPCTIISTWEGKFPDILTTHCPKNIEQKLYCRQVQLWSWNLLGSIPSSIIGQKLYLSHSRLRLHGPQSSWPPACL